MATDILDTGDIGHTVLHFTRSHDGFWFDKCTITMQFSLDGNHGLKGHDFQGPDVVLLEGQQRLSLASDRMNIFLQLQPNLY